MKLGHILLAIVLGFTIGLFAPFFVAKVGLPSPVGELLVYLTAALAAIVVAGPISRLLGMTPLMIFAGPCPNCHERPQVWWGRHLERDRLLLACGHCRTQVELWMRRPALERVGTERPAYGLRWPEFLGIWRRIEKTNNGR